MLDVVRLLELGSIVIVGKIFFRLLEVKLSKPSQMKRTPRNSLVSFIGLNLVHGLDPWTHMDLDLI